MVANGINSSIVVHPVRKMRSLAASKVLQEPRRSVQFSNWHQNYLLRLVRAYASTEPQPSSQHWGTAGTREVLAMPDCGMTVSFVAFRRCRSKTSGIVRGTSDSRQISSRVHRAIQASIIRQLGGCSFPMRFAFRVGANIARVCN